MAATPLVCSSLHSRFDVRSMGEPAWTTDEKGTVYCFDGVCFSRRTRHDDAFALICAWQTPAYGWLRTAESGLPVRVEAPAPAPRPLIDSGPFAA